MNLPNTEERLLNLQDFPTFFAFDELSTYQKNDTPPDNQPPRWTIDDFKKYLKSGASLFGVFEQHEMVIMYIFHVKGKDFHIGKITVHPKCRDQGIGTSLIHLAEQGAKKHLCETLSLTVDPFNGRGVHVYLKTGFYVTGFKRDYFGENHPDIKRFWMEKFLYPKPVTSQTREIRVDQTSAIEKALQEGFVGTKLLRSPDGDNRHNIVIFQALA